MMEVTYRLLLGDGVRNGGESFLGSGNVLFLDLSDCLMGAIICKNVLSCTLKICALYYVCYASIIFLKMYIKYCCGFPF